MDFLKGLFSQLSLRASVGVLSATFLIIFLLLNYQVLSTRNDSALTAEFTETAHNQSKVIFQYLYHSMRNGWTKKEINAMLLDMNQATPDMQVFLQRSSVVEEKFGKRIAGFPEKWQSYISKIEKSKAELVVEENQGKSLTFFYPIIAKKECLTCHTNSAIGNVHGVLILTYEISHFKNIWNEGLTKIIVLSLFLSIIVFSLYYSLIGKIIVAPLRNLTYFISGTHHNIHNFTPFDVSTVYGYEIKKMASNFNELIRNLQEKNRAIETGRSNQLKEMQIAQRVIENNQHGIVITDAKQKIVSVNTKMSEITGYSVNEMLGNNPNMFSSGMHTSEFYADMWKTIEEVGSWQGLIWNKHKNGSMYEEWLKIDAIKDKNGLIMNYVSFHINNTTQKKLENQVNFLAYYDSLTGLPNRVLLKDRMTQIKALSYRDRTSFAVLFIDLDRFKYINDTLGHETGDALLKEVSARLLGIVRNSDTVARLGGDEFVIVLVNVDKAHAVSVADKIVQSFQLPFQINKESFTVNTSIGVSVYPFDGEDYTSLLQTADIAMYHAKHAGRNNYAVYERFMSDETQKRFSMENDIREALEEQHFELYFQPQMRLSDNKICGAEVLIRWNHPEKGFISPADFIPIAEETGQILDIGEWVLRTSFEKVHVWRRMGHEIHLSVNISIRQLQSPCFVERLALLMHETEALPELINLEITEGIMADDREQILTILKEIRALGFGLSIDDFGTGFSNLKYLRKFPVNQLKIDKSFIRDLFVGGQDASIVEAIIQLGKQFNLELVAEGVETEEQKEWLREHGCDNIQGYLYSRPIPNAQFLEFYQK